MNYTDAVCQTCKQTMDRREPNKEVTELCQAALEKGLVYGIMIGGVIGALAGLVLA